MLFNGIQFGGASAAVFLLLGAACYRLYGQRFIDEAFLHHVTRRDPRHNFSPHFYPIYLDQYGHQSNGSILGGNEFGRVADPVDGKVSSDNLLHSSNPHLRQLAGELMHGMIASEGHGVDNNGAGVFPSMSTLSLPDVAMWSSVVQLLCQLVLAGMLHGDLPVCMLIQTMTFVALNKVGLYDYMSDLSM